MTGRRLADDGGFSLIELLAAISIMGIAVVTILGAMGTSIFISDLNRKQANAQTILRSAAESIKAASYVACPSPDYPVPPPPSGYQSTYQLQAYDDGTGTWSAPCASSVLQRIAIHVTSTDGRASESLQIVKRKP